MKTPSSIYTLHQKFYRTTISLQFTIMKSTMSRVFPILITLFSLVKSNETTQNITFPSFLQVCHQSDPNLSECVKKSVEKIKPMLAKGIPEFGIPSLEPLCISEVLIDHGAGAISLKSTYTDIKVYGPSLFTLKSVKIDLKKDRVRIKLWLPHLQVVSQYTMDGRILMMPISGKGESCGNYTNIDVTVTMQGQRITKNKNTFFSIKDFYVDFVLGHATIDLQNLFNGDKHLGDAMNLFLNENWQSVAKEIKPVLEDTIASIFKKMANKIFSKYPIDLILPE